MSTFREILFPAQTRLLPGHRWINITLRAFHLIGIAGLGAGFFYTGVDNAWHAYYYITLSTGLLMTLLSIWSNGIWLLQLRGQLILFKLLLLLTATVLPSIKFELILLIIALSSVVSHAPGDIRYYSIYHGRRIETI